MKVSALDIITATQGLGELMGMTLPIALSFKLARLAKAIGAEAKVIYEERDKLIVKYGEKDDKGQTKVKPENLDAFNADAAVLYSQEVTLDLDPVELPATIELKPGTLVAAFPFVTFPA
ncbi:MAG: hypothetical protein M0R22_13795 [Dehalococcoidia bacterium]|nr:hypothetical protein [Dehalococcoidia bacterium]